MTDINKLKAAIVRNGMTAYSLAEAIGISKQSLSYKMNNKRDFRAPEIDSIVKVLNLTPDEIADIFFTQRVDKSST